MELSFRRQEKIVGVFMFAIVILMLVSVVIIGRGKDWFKTYVTYYTFFKETYNLQEGAPVKMSKADIGKVEKITLYEDRVRVKLLILEEYAPRIRKDSIAMVESPTFIGSEYVSIKAGSPKAPHLEEGAEIPSQAKKSIDDILAEFKIEETAKKVVAAAQDLSALASKLSDPEGPLFIALNNINNILSHVEGVTRDINEGRGNVGELLKTRTLLEKVYAELDRVDKILANIENGSQDVPQITTSVKRGVSEIRQGVKRIDSVVQAVQQNPLIKPSLPPEPKGEATDAGLRK
jgi:phospholipid/cholesterol/gamma-HCH transport system substrate-binding protein